jgi:hypothetical protein
MAADGWDIEVFSVGVEEGHGGSIGSGTERCARRHFDDIIKPIRVCCDHSDQYTESSILLWEGRITYGYVNNLINNSRAQSGRIREKL